VVVVVGLAAYGQWRAWQGFLHAPIAAEELNIWLPPGGTLSSLLDQLRALGLARSHWHWRVYGRWQKRPLQAGEYRFSQPLSVHDMLAGIAAGDTRVHRFTIVEGWTVDELLQRMGQDPRLQKKVTAFDQAALMSALGCPGCFAEGRFLPETYFFSRPTSDLDLLGRAYTDMRLALEAVWADRAPELPLKTATELLVLASLVESETRLPEERARVAGVFVRRLRQGMRLQTDPSVIYGLAKDHDGRLTRNELRTDHPWNTYTRHGLPPTPIALPGLAALRAAARPAPGSALYFVARGDGSHQFSDTLDEHNAAVKRYIRGR